MEVRARTPTTHFGRGKILVANGHFSFNTNELLRAKKARAARDFIPMRAAPLSYKGCFFANVILTYMLAEFIEATFGCKNDSPPLL